MRTIETIYGAVRVKVAFYEGSIVNVQPEYEDCAKLALKHQLPWRFIHQTVLNDGYVSSTIDSSAPK